MDPQPSPTRPRRAVRYDDVVTVALWAGATLLCAVVLFRKLPVDPTSWVIGRSLITAAAAAKAVQAVADLRRHRG